MHTPHFGLVKELIAVVVGQKSIRCLALPERQPVVLRPTGGVRGEAEGEVLQTVVRRQWRFGHTDFISGKVIGGYIDGRVLSPVPLGLTKVGVWNPGQDWVGLTEAVGSGEMPDWMRGALKEGPRVEYEMEQVIPGYDYKDFDPIVMAADYARERHYDKAFELLHTCLKGDLRCIDAYAHLGLYRMRSSTYAGDQRVALKCYRSGVAVGERAFPPGFDGVLPWGRIDNRPFLRALHGLGICQWRSGLFSEAEGTFRRLWRFDPRNSLGAYELLMAVQDRHDYLAWVGGG